MQQAFSPQKTTNSQAFARGESPAVPEALQQPPLFSAPVSPDVYLDSQQTPRAQHIIGRSTQQSERGTTFNLEHIQWREDDQKTQETTHERSPELYNGLLHPTPRGHCHNISLDRDREAENTECYPGENVDGLYDRRKCRDLIAVGNIPNPSPQLGRWSAAHEVTPSVLNPAATEFKFDPQKWHSTNLSIPSSAHLPTSINSKVSNKANEHGAIGSLSNLNFTVHPYKPLVQNMFIAPSRFGFSAERLAPAGVPVQEGKTPSIGDTVVHDRIFDSVDLAEIVKPSKKSSAIPLVNATNAAKHEPDNKVDCEDSDGWTTQGDARRKTGRMVAVGGGEAAKLAELPNTSIVAVNDNLQTTRWFEPFTDMTEPFGPPSPEHPPSPVADKLELSPQENVDEGVDTPWLGTDSREIRDDVHETEEYDDHPVLPSTDTLTQSNAVLPSIDVRVPPNGLAYPATELTDKDPLLCPSIHENDDIMDYFNKGDAKAEVQSPANLPQSSPNLPFPGASDKCPEDANIESEPFSDVSELPKVDSNFATIARQAACSMDDSSTSRLADQRDLRVTHHSIRRLGSASHLPISIWDDILSSGEELKIPMRSQFLDTHFSTVIETLLRRHFDPLQMSLRVVGDGVRALLSKDALNHQLPFRSGAKGTGDAGERSNGDADDEDDGTGTGFHHPLGPRSDAGDEDDDRGTVFHRRLGLLKAERKLEKMKVFVMDAILSSQAGNLSRLERELELRHAAEHRAREVQSLLDLSERTITLFKERSNNTLAKLQGLEQDRKQAEHILASMRRERDVIEQENTLLKEAVELSDERYLVLKRKHQEAERRVSDVRKLLELSEREIVLFEESSKNNEHDLRVIRDEQEMAHQRVAALEGTERELRSNNSVFSAQIVALEGTLDEYRTSSTNWRNEIDQANEARVALNTNLETLREEADDHHRVRTDLATKLEESQKSMLSAADNFAHEKAMWKKKDEEQAERLEALEVRLDEGTKIRSNLENRVVTLEKTNARLEVDLKEMTEKSANHLVIASQLECDANKARDSAAAEVQRLKSCLEAEIEVANRKVDSVQADMNTRLEVTRADLHRARTEIKAQKSRFGKALEQAAESGRVALKDAAKASSVKIRDQRQRFEKSLTDMSVQRDRAMKNTLDDKQRCSARIEHLQEKVRHLEEKVVVAQSAAQAAAIAAQSASISGNVTRHIDSADVSETISPQAFQESIAMLQEQLQQREARIEDLEKRVGDEVLRGALENP